MTFSTADLCDQFPDSVSVAEPLFRDFGGRRAFSGPIETVRVREDNALVRQALESPGHGRVLVVDGGGSLRTALVGGRLAVLAEGNGWSGILVHGCVRDSAELGAIPIGIKALASCPRKSGKAGVGERGVAVSFGGVTFSPGAYLYADQDGVLIAARNLLTD
jgi:regulator of ribonuclease activity A